MILRVLDAPHPTLTKSALPVQKIDRKVLTLIENMKDTLVSFVDPVGVGLAAPQVGVSLKLCMIRLKTRGPIEVLINPEITHYSKEKKTSKTMLEGCLSIQNTWGHVTRSATVDVTYLTPEGKKITEHLTGYKAHVVQHEVDHLQGVLFTQRALEQDQKLYQIEKEKGREKLVPIEL